jgi:hypothetical protein
MFKDQHRMAHIHWLWNVRWDLLRQSDPIVTIWGVM